ncbi:serine protease grass-like [Episyrphus balteatus]|uniref:serine protease grass-like n=1 Tax=Episyrphus balteatus TaxID=286459 RepID=UPI0024865AEE|nr:serine protease grass-like [Episyrphus balteatus]
MFTRFAKLILFAIVFILSFDYHKVYAQSSCTTLRCQTGVCVPILTCKIITQLLKIAPRPLPPTVTDVIRRSHCGTFNNIPHVCCDANNIENADETEQQSTQAAPVVSTSRSKTTVRRSSEFSERQIKAGMNILDKTDCGKSNADKISNGVEAGLSEFPWMALLVYTDGVSRTLDCGGSLITDRYVLTASHCIRSPKKKLVSAILGEHNKSEPNDCVGEGQRRKCAPPTQEIDIEEAIYHKDFRPNPRFANDIALIRLVTFGQFVYQLPKNQKQLNWLTIAGWGKIENQTSANALQKATVPLRENNYCDEKLGLIRLTDDQLCAGGGDKKIDTCLGDSGGPIFYAVPYRFVLMAGFGNLSTVKDDRSLKKYTVQGSSAVTSRQIDVDFEKPIIRKSERKTDEEINSGYRILEASKCGKREIELTKTTDKTVQPQEFPWMALLVYFDGLTRTLGCDGSLITERYVLTTAQCIRMENKTLVSVRLGEYNTLQRDDCTGNEINRNCAPPVQEIDVEEAIYYQDYDPNSISFIGDIGLVRLKTKAILRSNVKPICLPLTHHSNVEKNKWMSIAGWNRLNKDQKSNLPFKALIPTINYQECQGIHIFIDLVDKHMCVGEDNVENNYCKGDSGTPMFSTAFYAYGRQPRFVQFGIVSLYGQFCNSMLPSIYVNVTSYLPWIAGNIRH